MGLIHDDKLDLKKRFEKEYQPNSCLIDVNCANAHLTIIMKIRDKLRRLYTDCHELTLEAIEDRIKEI